MTTQAAPSTQQLAQTYLRITRPANAEADRFRARANRWSDKTTNAQAARDAAPLIAAIQEADNQLLRISWPASTAADLKALVTAQGALIGDLQALKTLNLLSAGDWTNQVAQDSRKVRAAAGIVRADLGLPPTDP